MSRCYNCGHAEDEHEWFRLRPCVNDDCDCVEYEETLDLDAELGATERGEPY